MDKATLVFSAFGLAGLLIVGRQVTILYMAVKQVFDSHLRCVLSAFLACFFLLFGLTLAGLSLSYVLTKNWSGVAHFMLLACLCAISGFLQLIPAKKRAKSVAQPATQVAAGRVEPTAGPVAGVTPAVAPASAEQTASATSAVPASAVTATAVAAAAAATEIDESLLPDAPAPAIISAIADDELDAWTPAEEEIAAPAAHSANAVPAVESEVVASPVVPELDPQSVFEMAAPAEIEELASAVQPEVPAAAVSSLADEPADVLDLNGVTKVSDAIDTVNAEHRVAVVEPASDNEVARPDVASTSDNSVAVA